MVESLDGLAGNLKSFGEEAHVPFGIPTLQLRLTKHRVVGHTLLPETLDACRIVLVAS